MAKEIKYGADSRAALQETAQPQLPFWRRQWYMKESRIWRREQIRSSSERE